MRIPIIGVQIKRAGAAKLPARTVSAATGQALPRLTTVFGWEVSRAPAGMVPRSDSSLINILPPFGTNPVSAPVSNLTAGMDQRYIYDDPRSSFYLALPSKLTPSQVLQILRSALGGDIWNQNALKELMLSSWPMLRKCTHELCEEVAYTGFKVKPYVEDEGEGPSEDAKERADLVTRAMKNFNPDPFSDEKEFAGMVYNFCDAVLSGISISEVMWEKRKAPKGIQGTEWMPRAAAWVHPRYYTFTNDGIIALFDNSYHRMYNLLAAQGFNRPDPRKFFCAQFMSMSGSSLGQGLIRPLAWYWSAAIFCKEWMLSSAQKYGSPFLETTYKAGVSPQELANLDAMMAQAGAQGWVRHIEGTTVTIHPAPATTGNDNPHRHLMDEADKAAMFLLLGQEGTTKSTPGKLGGEDQKSKVKRQRVEGIAKWICKGALKQFARSVLQMNYGNVDMCPDLEPDFTEAVDPLAQAQTDAVFVTNKVPMLADEFYKRNGMQMPEAGDQVLIGGQLCVLKDDSEEVSSVTPLPPVANTGDDEQDLKERKTPQLPVAGRNAAMRGGIYNILKKANTEQLSELRQKLVVAEEAERTTGHVNGEWDAVVETMNKIAGGKR